MQTAPQQFRGKSHTDGGADAAQSHQPIRGAVTVREIPITLQATQSNKKAGTVPQNDIGTEPRPRGSGFSRERSIYHAPLALERFSREVIAARDLGQRVSRCVRRIF